jgi:polar amino acid transport system permease protein
VGGSLCRTRVVNEFFHYLTFPFLWRGLLIALEISVFAFAAALPLAVMLALIRLSRVRWIRLLPAPFIWLMRGSPLLLQLIFWFDFLPQIGVHVSAEVTAIIGLGLNEVAFSGEIIRGGIQSVRQTQRESAAALGMSRGLVLRRIVLPQALRSIAPALSNEAIVMIKNTSLASVIAVNELTLRSQQIVSTNFQYVPVFLGAAVMYLIATSLVVLFQNFIEKRLDVEARGRTAAVESLRQQNLQPQAQPGGSLTAVARSSGSAEPADADAAGRRLVLEMSRSGGDAERPGSHPFVGIVDVRKSFHGRVVLDGISLTVERGSVLFIIGPSGSGKTTLLRTINHLEPIDSGSITVDGKMVGYRRTPTGQIVAVRNVAQARADARIGFVFQNFNLFDHMTVLENIMEAPVRVYKRNPDEVREDARALLAWAGLGGYEGRYVHQLSGGQQQRIAIARALACRPRLMLFDEPTSALDPELVGEVLGLIRELAEDGMTMIVVSHEISFARACADRIIFMDEGGIIEEGPPDRVLEDPQKDRTRQFLRLVERGPV